MRGELVVPTCGHAYHHNPSPGTESIWRERVEAEPCPACALVAPAPILVERAETGQKWGATLFDEFVTPTTETPPKTRPGKMPPKRAGAPDNFGTPPQALFPLLPFLPRDWTIWEPAAGDGHLVRALATRGYRVTGTDLRDGHDFLLMNPPKGTDAIVTNPPYSGKWKAHFIRRCLDTGLPFALLFPFTVLEGASRQKMIDDGRCEVLIMPYRVHFITPDHATTKKKSSAWFPILWLTRGLNLPSPLTFGVDCRAQYALPTDAE